MVSPSITRICAYYLTRRFLFSVGEGFPISLFCWKYETLTISYITIAQVGTTAMPRRGNTREVQLTPHQRRRSEVWGRRMRFCGGVSETRDNLKLWHKVGSETKKINKEIEYD